MNATNLNRIEKPSSLDEMEQILSQFLKPVTPRIEFVRDLKQRLLNPAIRSQYIESAGWVLLIAASIFSTFFLLVVSVRAIIMILSALGLISHYKKEIINKKLKE